MGLVARAEMRVESSVRWLRVRRVAVMPWQGRKCPADTRKRQIWWSNERRCLAGRDASM